MTKTALVLIDIQSALQETGFYGSERNNPHAEANAQSILQFFRDKGWPVFHVKHDSSNPESPLAPGKPGNSFNPLVAPLDHEPVFRKSVNSGFIGTNLEQALRKVAVTDLVIVGLTTEHCVSTTARMAANLGFNNTLVSDATAAFDKIGANGKRYPAELIHEISLETLRDEFAEVIDSESLLKRLAGS